MKHRGQPAFLPLISVVMSVHLMIWKEVFINTRKSWDMAWWNIIQRKSRGWTDRQHSAIQGTSGLRSHVQNNVPVCQHNFQLVQGIRQKKIWKIKDWQNIPVCGFWWIYRWQNPGSESSGLRTCHDRISHNWYPDENMRSVRPIYVFVERWTEFYIYWLDHYMKKIPFYPNPDNTHCFQAVIKMILKYYFPKEEYSWKELEKLTGNWDIVNLRISKQREVLG